MRASDDQQACPVCGASGLRRKRKGLTFRNAKPEDRCLGCNGNGIIPTKRLRALVLAGVRAMAATAKRRSANA
jgi:DnaJ-class molecular chaperone